MIEIVEQTPTGQAVVMSVDPTIIVDPDGFEYAPLEEETPC